MRSGLLGKNGFYGWISLATAAVVVSFAGGGIVSSFGAFLPSICRDCAWSRATVSGSFTFLMVLMCLSSPLAGFLSEKWGPKRVVVAGSFMIAAGLLLLSYLTRFWELYLGYGVLLGLGSGLAGPIPASTVANNWFQKKLGLAMGIAWGSLGFGGLTIIPLVMVLIERLGWRSTYICLCVLIVVFGAAMPLIFLKNKPEDLGQTPDGVGESDSTASASCPPVSSFTVKEATRTSTFWLLVAVQVALCFLFSMLMAHEVAFLEGIGIGSAMAASALGLLMGLNTLGNVGLGFLSLKFELPKIRMVGPVLLFFGITLILFTRSLPLVFAYTVFVGLGYGATLVTSVSLISTYFGREHYAAITGFLMLLGAVGYVGPMVAGVIYDHTKSYKAAFLIGLLAACIVLFCMFYLKEPVPGAPTEMAPVDGRASENA